MSYEYPLNPDWTTQEIVNVVNLLSAIERVYESGMALSDFQQAYRNFKQIVTSIGEEKRIDSRFQQVSGYSLYRVVQEMKRLEKETASSKKHKKLKLE